MEDESHQWRMNLISGFGRCRRFMGGSRSLSLSIRCLFSWIFAGSSRWRSSKNHGGYPGQIKFVGVPDGENRRRNRSKKELQSTLVQRRGEAALFTLCTMEIKVE
ncbi:Uncharacterized protein Rs2_31319 [Raphanus sativus]|nr:Uncharacterized protein Rs2_37508 [Raphanus sativus]KAJ4891571.1 Uncharacterized protein Rs2_31319 [Raphanus sativus]